MLNVGLHHAACLETGSLARRMLNIGAYVSQVQGKAVYCFSRVNLVDLSLVTLATSNNIC